MKKTEQMIKINDNFNDVVHRFFNDVYVSDIKTFIKDKIAWVILLPQDNFTYLTWEMLDTFKDYGFSLLEIRSMEDRHIRLGFYIDIPILKPSKLNKVIE